MKIIPLHSRLRGDHPAPEASSPFPVPAEDQALLDAYSSAILDALRPLGIEHIDMPATPSRVWAAINRSGTTNAAAE